MLRPIIAEFVTFSVSEIRRLVPSSAAGFLSWPFGRWRRFYGSGFVTLFPPVFPRLRLPAISAACPLAKTACPPSNLASHELWELYSSSEFPCALLA